MFVVRIECGGCCLSVLIAKWQPPAAVLELFWFCCFRSTERRPIFALLSTFAPLQLITFYKEVFEREGLPLWLKPYSILSTAKTTGLIEVSKGKAHRDTSDRKTIPT